MAFDPWLKGLDRNPDAEAVRFGDRSISRSEIAALAARAAQVVGRIAPKGDEAVAFVVRNRPSHLAALFGLLDAQRPIRFVNAFQTPEKIVSDIGALAARVVLADAQDWRTPPIAELASQGGIAAVACDDGISLLKPVAAAATPGPSLAGTALEITTSGTTGTPKRIRFSAETLQAALVDQARIAAEMGEAPASAGAEATLIQYAPILHIAGLWTALQAGLEGRRLVLTEKFDAARWVEAVAAFRPRLAGMSPPLLRMVLELDPPREALASLQAIRCGSTALDAQTRSAFEQRYGILLLGVYGATEYAGVVASWSIEDHRRFAAAKPAAAGRVRRDVAEARVVDPADGRILATDEAGVLELRVPRVGQAWMRTTDLATLDADGFLHLHGRTDSAIIRGGFKILPDQLVALLRRHPAVLDASVVGLPDKRLGQVPVAAVELRAGAAADGAEFDRHLRAELPAYQVPVRYRIVDRLPRTPAAKIITAEVLALFQEDGDVVINSP